jgi:hypothetical protein
MPTIRKVNGADIGIRAVSSIVRPRSYCFYGRSGAGKTTTAASFPKPILLLDVRDRGTESIKEHKDIDVKDINNLEDLEDAYYFLIDNPKRYKTVVIDTVTQLQQVMIEEVVSGSRKSGKSLGDWGSMTRRQFGDVSALMKEQILNFRNLNDVGIQVVFIAQERVSASEEENPDQMLVPEVGPATMPSIAIHLNANVSVIGNSFIRIRKRRITKGNKEIIKEEALHSMRVGSNPVYITKIRKPREIEVPAIIDNPTYQDIEDVINGK